MPTASPVSAALNNAAWCDAVCRAAGGTTEFTGGLWRNAVPSPAYFPNVVTLDSTVELAEVETALRELSIRGLQVGVKDSFCALNLEPIGFRKLLEASWIWRDPVLPTTPSTQLAWTKIDSSANLRAWELEWWPEEPSSAPHQAIFGPSLLDCGHISFFAGHHGTALVAGAAITETEDVAGLTCTFFHGSDPAQQRRELLSVLGARYPGRVILGYDSGAELLAMRELAFREIGPLCVWLSPAPR